MGENLIKIKHSYNAGDAITILPGLQHIYKTLGKKAVFMQVIDMPAYYYEGAVHPIQSEGKNVCMNMAQWNRLKPLLEAQEYIAWCEVWEGQEFHIDFDTSRDKKSIPMPNGDIHHWPFFIAPELACDLSAPWLSTDEEYEDIHGYKDTVIINRTERYFNPYITFYFLKEYEQRCLFVGTSSEHDQFCTKFNLNIHHLQPHDFYLLATIIERCKFFVGNQSLCWHLADAIKAPRILEYCPQFPNTHPTGGNGYAFLYQQALELYFKKLINQ